MRTALIPVALIAAGCARSPAEPPAIAPAPRAAAGPEVWKVTKIELPTKDGVCAVEFAGVEFVMMKGRPADPGVPPPRPAVFSHEHHAAGLGIDCRYCHPAAAGKQTVCFNCHQQEPTATAVKGKRWSFAVERDPVKAPKEIDATECDADGRPLPETRVRRGVYEEVEGGRLRVALTFGDVPAGFRPNALEPVGLPKAAGVAVLHLAK